MTDYRLLQRTSYVEERVGAIERRLDEMERDRNDRRNFVQGMILAVIFVAVGMILAVIFVAVYWLCR